MVSISEMVNQSLTVITKPSVETFEQFERSGTIREAAIYVALGSLITGVLGFSGGLGAVLGGVISSLIGFFIFTGLIYYVGKAFGGTGSFDEVAYTFSLFWVPMSVLGAIATLILFITIIGILLIPILAIVVLIANAYFAYLAVQSSMNMKEQGKLLLTLVIAVIGSALIQGLITSLATGATGTPGA